MCLGGCVVVGRCILKAIWKCKRTRIIKAVLNKDKKSGRFALQVSWSCVKLQSLRLYMWPVHWASWISVWKMCSPDWFLFHTRISCRGIKDPHWESRVTELLEFLFWMPTWPLTFRRHFLLSSLHHSPLPLLHLISLPLPHRNLRVNN